MSIGHWTRRVALPTVLYGVVFSASALEAEDPFIIGVCSHELHLPASRDTGFELLRQAGIESVRTDAHWAFVERSRNKLAIEPHWNTYLAKTQAQGIDSLLILGYGNIHHGDGEKPRSEPIRAAYNRYVAFVAQQLRGRVRHYEVWNEWDLENPDDPEFSQDYARLVADAAGIIRQHDPDAKVLAGAVTSEGIKSGFALRLIEAGVMQSVDGLSLHPYVHCYGRGRDTPEAWIKWLTEIDLDLSRAANQPVPLYLTEMAWPSHKGACGFDETTQAAYLARSYFLAKTLPNVRGYWWYDFRNDGADLREREHNFGLLRQDYSPKLAYQVLKAISPIIEQFQFLERVAGSDESTVQLRFDNGEEQLLIAWSTDKPRSVSITSNGPKSGEVELIDSAQPNRGRTAAANQWQCPADGKTCSARIELGEFPKIISLGASDPAAVAPEQTNLAFD
ncbi:hypothetical protein ACMYUJ_15930 [Stutzerimonas zhaodongensis]|uniref:hypothetical protein n=1 Tax=Stutzerimonas zhaodongensis TaxID=1176257 RepID=UPI0039F0682D